MKVNLAVALFALASSNLVTSVAAQDETVWMFLPVWDGCVTPVAAQQVLSDHGQALFDDMVTRRRQRDRQLRGQVEEDEHEERRLCSSSCPWANSGAEYLCFLYGYCRRRELGEQLEQEEGQGLQADVLHGEESVRHLQGSVCTKKSALNSMTDEQKADIRLQGCYLKKIKYRLCTGDSVDVCDGSTLNQAFMDCCEDNPTDNNCQSAAVDCATAPNDNTHARCCRMWGCDFCDSEEDTPWRRRTKAWCCAINGETSPGCPYCVDFDNPNENYNEVACL